MGPVSRYLGPLVPAEPQIWQDPVPPVTHELIGAGGHRRAQGHDPRLGPDRSPQLVSTAWAAASTFRGTDKRGGANGARLRLAPAARLGGQQPGRAGGRCCGRWRRFSSEFNGAQAGGKQVSLADLIVLGGCAAVEQAAKNAGHDVEVPFAPGPHGCSRRSRPTWSPSPCWSRSRTGSATTSASYSRGWPSTAGRPGEPADADRARDDRPGGRPARAERELRHSSLGVFTDRPETLTNDFFVNLLDMGTVWQPTSEAEDTFEGRDRGTGELKWTGSRFDLIFGSNSQLRAIAEVYASERRAAEVRARLRGRVGQGHEPRPVRSGLTVTSRPAAGRPGRSAIARSRPCWRCAPPANAAT